MSIETDNDLKKFNVIYKINSGACVNFILVYKLK